MWQKDIGSTPDYQERMKQQAERRKEILAMKAKRRGKGKLISVEYRQFACIDIFFFVAVKFLSFACI